MSELDTVPPAHQRGSGRRSGQATLGVMLLGAAALGAGPPPRTPPPGQPFRLEYWATGHCPDAVEFARQIQKRAPKLRPAEPGEPSLAFFAELSERDGGAVGRLTAREVDGREVTREVSGISCEDVVTALALIAALSVDPNQTVTPSPPPSSSAAAPDGSPAPAELPGDGGPSSFEPLRSADSASGEPLPAWAYGVGVGVGLDTAIAPNPGAGMSVSLEVESRRPGAYRPLFSLAINRAQSTSTSVPGGSASFTWLALRVADCPVLWPEERPLYVRPCAFLDGGSLEADMLRASTPSDRTVGWFAVGGFGRLQADAFSALSLTLDGGFVVPLIRGSFHPPQAGPEMFRVPRLGMIGRIGLSAKF